MSQLPNPAYMHWKLPNWLRRFFRYDAPAAQAAASYECKLMAAYARSIEWGLQPPRFEPISFRYASGETIASTQRLLDYGLGGLREDVIAAQRFGLIAMVRGLLEAQLRVRVAYTLGYVCLDGYRLCHTPIEGLEQMLRTGIAPGSRINLHAWLTLPSHEIMDPTFWAVFPAHALADERQARGLFLHPDQMSRRSYHPQWVGEGFVRKIGVLEEYEGW
ncbi:MULTISPECIES: hypothetical protein [unclassified Lysobacter]|uniref:hypothetical protein n=1 Tax=unclassified Lysobacter TaxID=2635362 RepID=UPI001BEA13F0|nr:MULTISPECIES: hypothetical protein [unclassified Lysobacter]MBT2748597.1 hypothetical protein [Lysobacter sp. ISL-42]MBT2751532.1 hypothetical protein [Lysobacter sp. ISL-50]MBT2775726.1 hypothetical protein [Lysobacter sp. ISL-54]MBT2782309.1 hypothetical protein [Lysobacter sp. ISL-52]